MARKYHVRGTNVYLFWAIGLLLLGLWCVKDGWFPAASVLERHPMETDKHFYLFNKSLAVITLIASAVCAYVHSLVK